MKIILKHFFFIELFLNILTNSMTINCNNAFFFFLLILRDDLGFRLISEQVSHHPPISAFHAEGLNNDFIFHGSIYPKLKFWGKSVEAEPKGTITLELLDHNEAYTWTNPTCCVHNIIVGKLWIEQYGNVEIINHK